MFKSKKKEQILNIEIDIFDLIISFNFIGGSKTKNMIIIYAIIISVFK